MKSHHIDWNSWQPKDRAILLFLIRDGQMLLIHKKRGLGAGKINGPGGRIEKSETAQQCAIREMQEELHITPQKIKHIGNLQFQFRDGYSLQCSVFVAHDFEGIPTETEEAKPFWVPIDDIPYEQMWADDRLWIPLMINGEKFQGRFIFENDTMLESEVVVVKELINNM